MKRKQLCGFFSYYVEKCKHRIRCSILNDTWRQKYTPKYKWAKKKKNTPNCKLVMGSKLSRQWLRKLGTADVYKWKVLQKSPWNTEQSGAEKASWNTVNTFHTRRAWKQHAWGFHLHLDENGPPREEIKPFLTPPLATRRPPVMCPVNGLWVYSTAGSPQHCHK